MQRLLRSRALYLGLAALVVALYVRAVAMGPIAAPEPAQPAAAAAPAEYWPQRIDVAAFQRLVQERPLVAAGLALFTVAAMGLAAAGVVLSAWDVLTGRVPSVWRIASPALPAWSFGELARIVVLILIVASLMPFVRIALLAAQPFWDLDHRLWMTVAMLALDGFAILVVLAFADGKSGSVWRAAGRSHGASRSVRIGLRGYVTVFPWMLLLLAVIVEVARFFNLKPPMEPMQELIFLEHRPWVFALTLLLACVVGPVAEELFFRGVLYSVIRRKASRWLAMAVSGGVFAAIHTNLLGFVPIMLLGWLLAYLYERTGSLAGPTVVHMAHNSLLMGLALIVRQITPGAGG